MGYQEGQGYLCQILQQKATPGSCIKSEGKRTASLRREPVLQYTGHLSDSQLLGSLHTVSCWEVLAEAGDV